MDAGELDRRITLQRQGADVDTGLGTEPGEFATLATVWARLMPIGGSEKIAALENASSLRRKFKIRRTSTVADLGAKDRMVFDGDTHDIVDVELFGRGFLIINAVVRGE